MRSFASLRSCSVPAFQDGCSSQTVAESFVKTIKRDYVAHTPKPDRETALRNLTIAFEHLPLTSAWGL
jgi:hypothetical protein